MVRAVENQASKVDSIGRDGSPKARTDDSNVNGEIKPNANTRRKQENIQVVESTAIADRTRSIIGVLLVIFIVLLILGSAVFLMTRGESKELVILVGLGMTPVRAVLTHYFGGKHK